MCGIVVNGVAAGDGLGRGSEGPCFLERGGAATTWTCGSPLSAAIARVSDEAIIMSHAKAKDVFKSLLNAIANARASFGKGGQTCMKLKGTMRGLERWTMQVT